MADFEISTKRKVMVVNIDGVDKELPLQPTTDEYITQFDALGITAHIDENGNVVTDDFGPSSMAGMMLWFRDFAAKYLGKSIKNAGNDDIQALKEAWDAKRESETGVSEGEA